MSWKAVLIFGAYFGLFTLTVLGILHWQKHRRRTRLPFGPETRLLRGPGESQLRQSRRLEEDGIIWLAVAGGAPALVGATMLSWVERVPSSLQLPWLVLAGVAFAGTFVFAVRWFARKAREANNRYLGYFGERIVAEYLEPLKQEGWRIFHDVPGRHNGHPFNLDHVAVGPGGVWVIETKTRRKGSARPGFDDHKVFFDGHELVWPWGQDNHGLEQAERSALWLARQIETELRERVHVSPLLALPGWFVERKPSRDSRLCKVANPKVLADLLARDQGLLTRQQIDAIAATLEARCRDVAY